MVNVTWDDYRRWLGDALLKSQNPAVAAPQVRALATDSRSIGKDEWFVPISGEIFDGHAYIAEAMQKGATGFFFSAAKKAALPADLVPFGIAVSDTLVAFQAIASGWRQQLASLKVVALTGSAGKTTTKEMLSAILAVDGPTLATAGSFNNEIGVPKTLQGLTPELRYAALEFGARKPGNIKISVRNG